ncbi:MAG: hypothetical protein ACLGI5_12115 [Thermoleophilia bacterium]
MLPPRTSTVAAATCAAAALARPAGGGRQPASLQAASQLAEHAARDAHEALGAQRRRRRHKLLARASRRLAYSYALTARLLTDHVPAAVTAGAIFVRSASAVAHDSAELAGCTDGRLQAFACTVLRRTSRLQADVALELSSTRSTGSLEQLVDALAGALAAQGELLGALHSAAGGRVSRRRTAALQDAAARANATHDALRAALAGARSAIDRPAAGERAAGAIAPPDPRLQKGPATDAGHDDRRN